MKGIENFEGLIKKLNNWKLKKRDSEGNSIEVEFMVNPPATISEIKHIEKELGIKLPTSYVEFLQKFNGARMYDYDGLDGFELLGTNDLVDINSFLASDYNEDWVDSILIFAKCIGEGNYLGFDSSVGKSEYCILDCFHEEIPINWEIISESFDQFLEKLIENEGKKYWLT